jgi:hypothetical protein
VKEDYWFHGRRARPVTVTTANAVAGSVVAPGPCRLCGYSLAAGTAEASGTTQGSVVAPAAGATIASINLPTGVYVVKWTVQLTGAAAAADADNFQLTATTPAATTSVNNGAAGIYQQADVTVVNGPAATTIAVKAIGAGTAGVTYTASIDAVPADSATGQILDQSQVLANVAVGPGLNPTQWLGDEGVEVTAGVAVLNGTGQLSGVVYVKYEGLRADKGQ